MTSGEGLEDHRQVSCPFCGARSAVAVPVVVTEAKAWRHGCPACGRFWRVKVWSARGKTGFSVEPDMKPDGGAC